MSEEKKEKVLHEEKVKEVKRLQDVAVEGQDTTLEVIRIKQGQSKTGKPTYYLETPDIVVQVWASSRLGKLLAQYADQLKDKQFTITIFRKNTKDGKPFYVVKKLAVKE